MSVRDNLSEGKYQPKLQYPAHSGTTREEYLKLRKEYGEESSRLLTEFKADLEDEFGVAGNPKADKLYSIAWDHAYGLFSVVDHYEELVDLIR